MKRGLRGALIVGITTLLEAIRNRLLLVALFFALVLVAASIAAASVSIWEQSRLIIDVGLAAASGLGSIIAIALTVASFSRELQRKTVYPILVRPIPRWAFVAGKYLGVVVAMELIVTAMVVATAGTVLLYGNIVPGAFWACLWLTWVEMGVVCAVATLFSTMAGPVLAATYTAAFVLAGNLSDDLARLAERVSAREAPEMGFLLTGAYYLLPDLQAFSLRAQAANRLAVPDGFMVQGTLYGLFYCLAVLAVAMWIFSRRKAF